MRTLASIQQIASFTPIEGRDLIVLANFVDWGWQSIVRKEDFKEGDLCVFIETDSLLPADNPNFEFMASKKFKVKPMKLSGIISEGLVMPISILPDGMTPHRGMDVTELLKITEFGIDDAPSPDRVVPHKKYPNWLMRHKWFRNIVLKKGTKREKAGFPSEISKTDETRIQERPNLATMYSPCVATEKVDGTSSTYLLRHIPAKHFWQKDTYEFVVCSHNRRLYDKSDMSWIWRNAEKYSIEQQLKKMLMYDPDVKDSHWIALQGETIAPKIQKNNYKLAPGETDLYVFNVITENKGRWTTLNAKRLVEAYDMKFVPILDWNMDLSDKSVNDILDYATGISMINPDSPREGVVFRSEEDSKKSFKAVSPAYKFKMEG